MRGNTVERHRGLLAFRHAPADDHRKRMLCPGADFPRVTLRWTPIGMQRERGYQVGSSICRVRKRGQQPAADSFLGQERTSTRTSRDEAASFYTRSNQSPVDEPHLRCSPLCVRQSSSKPHRVPFSGPVIKRLT